ncbi:UNVERIFIED_CONTAM: Glucan endo-1,3-beta-glucosidase 13 [Sesamum radiatum]|uniref:Glucan endo-1,3-beta-glucosidase 13 n=1 Tax=Sesamum radiatum TaxID=300843 RepID=A0AAW2KG49_SESRA
MPHVQESNYCLKICFNIVYNQCCGTREGRGNHPSYYPITSRRQHHIPRWHDVVCGSTGASPADLQIALDWACGLGKADCRAIQAGGPCFEPDTLLSHASFAFNNYYQQNGNSDIACYFGGTAALTQNNPSHGRCVFATSSESIKASAASSWEHKAKSIWWKIDVILLLLYLGRR